MVKSSIESRYYYKCTPDSLLKMKHIPWIYKIIQDADKKQITQPEIIEIGRKKYKENWPTDKDTILRSLNTMHKFELVDKTSRVGKKTLWHVGERKIPEKILMNHEIEHTKDILSNIPRWVFDSGLLRNEVEIIRHKIRDVLVDIENLDSKTNSYFLLYKELVILSDKEFSELDRILSLVFFYCERFNYKKSDIWFDLTERSFSVKSDIELADIIIKNFYPEKGREDIFKLFEEYKPNLRLPKKLWFLRILHIYMLLRESNYQYDLFEKGVISQIKQEKIFEDAIHEEKINLFQKRLADPYSREERITIKNSKSQDINSFISNYKRHIKW